MPVRTGQARARRRGSFALIVGSALICWPALSKSPSIDDLPRPIYRTDPCAETETDLDSIVICGRRGEQQRFRLPPAFRMRPDGLRDSWMMRSRNELDQGRFADQVIGSFGYLLRQQEEIYQWKKEREQLTRDSDFRSQ